MSLDEKQMPATSARFSPTLQVPRRSESSSTIVLEESEIPVAAILQLPYEVLEAVLLQLPLQDLLLCQRICQRFRTMVSSSKSIRRALFLEPAHHNGKLCDWTLLRFNPFLATSLAQSFNIRVIGVHRGEEGSVKMVAHMRFEKETLLDQEWADILLHEDASWKSMLVCSPDASWPAIADALFASR